MPPYLEATTVRIYKRDQVPIWDLFSAEFIHRIEEAFGFEDLDTSHDEKNDPDHLTFTRGFLDPDAPTDRRPVRSLTLDDRRIEVVVAHPDGHAAVDRFLTTFEEVAGVVDDGPNWLKNPQTETSNTVWIGPLAIDPLALLDPRLRAAAEQVRAECKTKQYDPILSLKGFNFRLTFNITDQKLLESSIYFRDREFRLEPRFGIPADERVWYSSSPLKSDQHMAILRQIEASYEA